MSAGIFASRSANHSAALISCVCVCVCDSVCGDSGGYRGWLAAFSEVSVWVVYFTCISNNIVFTHIPLPNNLNPDKSGQGFEFEGNCGVKHALTENID